MIETEITNLQNKLFSSSLFLSSQKLKQNNHYTRSAKRREIPLMKCKYLSLCNFLGYFWKFMILQEEKVIPLTQLT